MYSFHDIDNGEHIPPPARGSHGCMESFDLPDLSSAPSLKEGLVTRRRRTDYEHCSLSTSASSITKLTYRPSRTSSSTTMHADHKEHHYKDIILAYNDMINHAYDVRIQNPTFSSTLQYNVIGLIAHYVMQCTLLPCPDRQSEKGTKKNPQVSLEAFVLCLNRGPSPPCSPEHKTTVDRGGQKENTFLSDGVLISLIVL